MKNLVKILFLISFISIFFDGYVFFIGPTYFRLFQIFVPLALLLYFMTAKNILKQIYILYKKTPFKYLIYFITWVFLDAILLLIMGKASVLILYSILVKLVSIILYVYLFISLFVPKIISIKKIISIFIGTIYIVFLFAIIEYLASMLNIQFILNFVDIISNLKQIAFQQGEMIDLISGSRRMRSIFHEPGALAGFIFMTLPIIYSVILSKYHIFKNNFINIVVKKTFIPLLMFVLFLTKSPIFLIFSILSTIIYFKQTIIKTLKNKYVTCGFVILLFMFIILFYNSKNEDYFQDTYLQRISNVIDINSGIDEIITKEPSLGSRIIGFITAMRAYPAHPIIGYGFDNLRYSIEPYLINSPIPLTKEMILAMTLYYKPGTGVAIWYCTITRLLTETGIIGFILFYIYLFSNIIYLNKYKKYLIGIEKDLSNGLKYFMYALIIFSFYNHLLPSVFGITFQGLIASLVLKARKNKQLLLENNNLGENSNAK